MAQIFVADMRASKLALAEKLGGTPLDVRAGNLASEVRKRTNGELIHYLIEASGAGPVFDLIPFVLRHQATFLFYGSGHAGRDVGCLVPFQVMETNMVTSARRFGGIRSGWNPRGLSPLDGVLARRTHRCGIPAHPPLPELSDLQQAFQVDSLSEDFIKGAWVKDPAL